MECIQVRTSLSFSHSISLLAPPSTSTPHSSFFLGTLHNYISFSLYSYQLNYPFKYRVPPPTHDITILTTSRLNTILICSCSYSSSMSPSSPLLLPFLFPSILLFAYSFSAGALIYVNDVTQLMQRVTTAASGDQIILSKGVYSILMEEGGKERGGEAEEKGKKEGRKHSKRVERIPSCCLFNQKFNLINCRSWYHFETCKQHIHIRKQLC